MRRRWEVARGSMRHAPWEVVTREGEDGGPEAAALCYAEGTARLVAHLLNENDARNVEAALPQAGGMARYFVFYGDFEEYFTCMAEDAGHAREQCVNAHGVVDVHRVWRGERED